MARKTGWVLVAALSAGVACSACVTLAGEDENEVKVELKDCPEAVQTTIRKEAGEGKIVEIEKEQEHGKTVYEAEVVIDGKEFELMIAEDGKLIEREEEGAEDDDDADEKDGDAKGTKEGTGGSK